MKWAGLILPLSESRAIRIISTFRARLKEGRMIGGVEGLHIPIREGQADPGIPIRDQEIDVHRIAMILAGEGDSLWGGAIR